jgi:hypothetical protein
MSGKGSKPRPFSVSQEEFSNNFDKIFGKKSKPENSDVQYEKGRLNKFLEETNKLAEELGLD